MIKRCSTAEEMKRLEAEVHYFYTHGGPVMDGIPVSEVPAEKVTPADRRAGGSFRSPATRVSPLDKHMTSEPAFASMTLEEQVAYFYTHGGPVLD